MNTFYLGAAHGIAGIMTTLLSLHSKGLLGELAAGVGRDKVKGCVDTLLSCCSALPEEWGGHPNLPTCGEEVGQRVELLHWCHGAPGFVYLLALAHQIFGEAQYLSALVQLGEAVWACGLLRKGRGLCHGTSGNGYALLLCYRATGDQLWLSRACWFARWSCDVDVRALMRTPDAPFSLFEGEAGNLCFFLDLLSDPQSARFPCFDF
eukprot:gnl/Spiro4/12767_TR6766_c0_g1_i1.p1 gnl/Spiro4/12767_TR6766_c0_g1~~gnl/Spiro4/12767_TR6766_c0_g1_i1.p1  ORF type:complete len:207 (+),score=12.25 gnl/Spiro4/12767_TR6766_c0_g1_i1:458-1078(+)